MHPLATVIESFAYIDFCGHLKFATYTICSDTCDTAKHCLKHAMFNQEIYVCLMHQNWPWICHNPLL